MVAQPIEAPAEVDQTPQEPQTEVVEETPAVAEPAIEEAAAGEPEQVTPPEERRYTEAELREQAQRLAADALEMERRARQSEGARRAAEEKRQQQEAAELRETTEVILSKADREGWSEEQRADALISRISAKRQTFDVDRQQGELQQALAWVTAPLRGDQTPYEAYGLSPTADAFARAIQPHLQQIMSAGAAQAVEGYVPKAEHDRAVAAARAAGRAERNDGKTELRRPEGQAPGTSSIMSWTSYMSLPEEDRMAMPATERQAIMAADRKARLTK